MKHSKYFKTGISLFTFAICSLNIIFLQKSNLKQQEIVKDDAFYFKEEKMLASVAQIQKKIPSFGFNNLLANLTFLRYVQYFGDGEGRNITGYSVVTDYFEDIVNRDPNFVQSHLVMSSSNSLFAARPTATVELINQALTKVTPDVPNYPFLLWTYKATDEILFLGDLKSARDSYLKAAEWAKSRQDDLGNEMAGRYQKSAEFLASDPDPTQAQVGAWMTILSTAKDKKTAEYVIDKLESLGMEVSISDDGQFVVKSPQDV